ncbi:UNVERIFIED_CONTAM: hypothetical protein KB581_08865 [Streptococcus canis]|nr:hypothetical protein Javan87_0005 [Streptococcus phage Javan87]QBX31999.1 hypothetical protein Javan90_0005 [Streptococcus phage Javan90]
MKLYKNVPLRDLEKILKDGILPASVTGNKRKDINRTDNSTDVVYLAKPITKFNSSYHYGDILIEVEVEKPIQTDFLEDDRNYLYYQEYVTDKVTVNQIKNIYVPKELAQEVKPLQNPASITIVFVDVLKTYCNKLAIYSDAEVEDELTNYNKEDLLEVVDVYERTVIVDKSTRKLVEYSNKDKKITYSAMMYDEENDFVDYFWTRYIEAGVIDDVELKLHARRPVIQNVFNCSISKLGNDITLEILESYIKNNQSKFFTKKGDWKKNSRKTMERLTAEDFKK